MSFGMMLTLPQALQLVGLAPCLFIVLFLLSLSRRNPQTIVPIFYFLALACGFALPLLQLYGPLARHAWIHGALLLGESTLTAFTFLLICQFLLGRVPPPHDWLVLAIPLVGGSSLLYAAILQAGSVCASGDWCYDTESLKVLYNIFSSALVFLLLVVYSSRADNLNEQSDHRRQKYWLILALILLHVLVLAVELAHLAGEFTAGEAQFAASMFRLTFIYLVLTSLFRVFYPALGAQNVAFTAAPPPEAPDYSADLPHAGTVRRLLEEDHIYREMRLNRAALARAAGISEHYLSRVINRHFGKGFNELVNGYRVSDAQARLTRETTPITTIGFEVGFNSTASFNRVFRDITGMSPTQWREASKEKEEK